jgi:hypothetical protein
MVVGIWKVTEPASDGRLSLLKLAVLLERRDMSPTSEEVWRCMAGEGAARAQRVRVGGALEERS